MDNYLDISYVNQLGREMSEGNIMKWVIVNCTKGIHLWDEVLSIDSHYLFCDACSARFDIKMPYYHIWDKRIVWKDFLETPPLTSE